MLVRRLVALGALLLCAPAILWAQAWPTRPIRVLIPFGAGSATDIVPRIVFEPMAAALGQPLIVENRVGGGGTVAAGAVAKADADGYTLLATSSAHTIVPAINANVTYDAARDFSAIIAFGAVPNVLIISPSKGIKTIQELVAAARAKPGSFNYASVGVGSATHLSVERLKLAAGFDAVHVPFRGGPEALAEVIAGRVELYFCPINTALPHIREGKLTALLVNSTKRASALPDIPTTTEVGYKDAEFSIWLGMLAPAKTPRVVVDRLYTEAAKAIALPATQDRLLKTGIEPLQMTPAEFDARVAAEVEANRAVVKAAGIKPN